MTTETATSSSFQIKECLIGELESKIGKINRRADKLGCDPVSANEIGRTFIKPSKAGNGETRPGFFLVEFEAVGSAPKLPGWSLVARLEHDPEIGTIVRAVPGSELPVVYRDAEPVCDHCKSHRVRKDTFVLVNDDGRYVQVGRQCVVDFLGGQAPENVLLRLEWFSNFADVIDGISYDEGSREDRGNDPRYDYIDLLQLVAKVVRVIHVDGWKSRAAARDDELRGLGSVASVDRALRLLNESKLTEEERIAYTGQPTDVDEAKAAIEWAANQDGDSDYESNIRKIAQAEVTTYSTAGVAGSIPAAYARHQERELDRAYEARNTLNEHYGEPKGRYTLVLECTGAREFESDWGVSTLVRWRDDDGRKYIWWASKEGVIDEVEAKLRYRVKCTVKKHDEYKGTKQTVLTRCNFAVMP